MTNRQSSWIVAGLAWRLRALQAKSLDLRNTMQRMFMQAIGFRGSEAGLISDSQNYWNGQEDRSLKQNSHWRGVGIFGDDTNWLTLGSEHFQLYERFARTLDSPRPVRRVVEWGCGGGMNAVHFGQIAEEFFGVDISSASLDECAQQMRSA